MECQDHQRSELCGWANSCISVCTLYLGINSTERIRRAGVLTSHDNERDRKAASIGLRINKAAIIRRRQALCRGSEGSYCRSGDLCNSKSSSPASSKATYCKEVREVSRSHLLFVYFVWGLRLLLNVGFHPRVGSRAYVHVVTGCLDNMMFNNNAL
ncbi:hypothetical protein NDU88_007259 [Pleurodeles waltl]|uniref:Uncharacterized protein n=1 Tax=Pleurodeles waltl TaxID=8319 RepID=A0AAV7RRC3_PLEWA|nr:hypothetical protein NDU88_007259 [Pleurodeles waltl]